MNLQSKKNSRSPMHDLFLKIASYYGYHCKLPDALCTIFYFFLMTILLIYSPFTDEEIEA